jgi:hypothetical protein
MKKSKPIESIIRRINRNWISRMSNVLDSDDAVELYEAVKALPGTVTRASLKSSAVGMVVFSVCLVEI